VVTVLFGWSDISVFVAVDKLDLPLSSN